jgi:hypothetical protein
MKGDRISWGALLEQEQHLLKARADAQDAKRAIEKFVKFHLSSAFFVGCHHQKIDFFAGKLYGHLSLSFLVQLLEFTVTTTHFPNCIRSTGPALALQGVE